jgi:phosphoribosylpyrophosphate synthetase
MAETLARSLRGDIGGIELRSFPDGETYLRFLSHLSGRVLVIACTLDRPNEKILPLLFAAATARELGAEKVGLVAPYLAYMRQDRRFKPGEAVGSGGRERFRRALCGSAKGSPRRSRCRDLRQELARPRRMDAGTGHDIISSGRTMIEAVRLIVERGAQSPICVAVHGLFAEDSDKILARAGARVVTSNSIPHATNGIDVTEALVNSPREVANAIR